MGSLKFPRDKRKNEAEAIFEEMIAITFQSQI